MTALLVLLAILQAGLLLWASIHLSNAFLRTEKIGPFIWAITTIGGATMIAYHAKTIDLNRFLCSTGDCIFLVVAVACIRVIVVTNENERQRRERDVAVCLAAEAAKTARKEREAQQLVAAAAALEARTAAQLGKAAAVLRPEDTRGPTRAPRQAPLSSQSGS